MSATKKRRRRARWGSAVPLPRARLVAFGEAPRLCVLLPDGPRVVENVDGIDLGDLSPVRHFRSSWKSRHAPQRPFIGSMGCHIAVESMTESVMAQLLDRDPGVDLIVPQPFWIERVGSERPGWAAPDFLVVDENGSRWVVEVKGGRDGLADATLDKMVQVRSACQAHGLPYHLWMALDVRQQQVFDLLQSYRSDRVLQGAEVHELMEAVRDAAREPLPLGELWALGPSLQIRSLIWHMLWHNVLCLDWTQIVNEETFVRVHDAELCRLADGQSRSRYVCGPRVQDRLPELLGEE